MRSRYKLIAAAAAVRASRRSPVRRSAQPMQPARASYANPGDPQSYRSEDLVQSGHQFFGSASRGLRLDRPGGRPPLGRAERLHPRPGSRRALSSAASAMAKASYSPAMPASAAIFWQGPSLGFDLGGEGSRTMMLVYNMPFTDALYKRFVGIDGSAYLIGGFGMTAAAADEMIVVPIRTGVGARLGVNIGYLKFTPEPTWNPF